MELAVLLPHEGDRTSEGPGQLLQAQQQGPAGLVADHSADEQRRQQGWSGLDAKAILTGALRVEQSRPTVTDLGAHVRLEMTVAQAVLGVFGIKDEGILHPQSAAVCHVRTCQGHLLCRLVVGLVFLIAVVFHLALEDPRRLRTLAGLRPDGRPPP